MAGGADFLGNPVVAMPAALGAVDDFVAGFIAYEKSAGAVMKAAAQRPAHGLLNLYAAALILLLETRGSGPRRAVPGQGAGAIR